MVVHIAASLYITSLPNHLQETVGKKDYLKKKRILYDILPFYPMLMSSSSTSKSKTFLKVLL